MPRYASSTTDIFDLIPADATPATNPLLQNLSNRLFSRRTIDPETECWIWSGNASEKGYSRIYLEHNHCTYRIRTNRLSWRLHNGPIPPNTFVLHSCDNRTCFNPSHLFLGDDKANQQDMISKGRIHFQSPKLTSSQAAEIRRRYADFTPSYTPGQSIPYISIADFKHNLAAEYRVHYTTIRDILNGRYHCGA